MRRCLRRQFSTTKIGPFSIIVGNEDLVISESGLLSWIPIEVILFDSVEVAVSDTALVDSYSFEISVTTVNDPPEIISQPDLFEIFEDNTLVLEIGLEDFIIFDPEYELTTERMIKHYKKCTNLKEKQIRQYLLPPHDVWLSAKQAKKLGICDKIKDIK